MVKKMERNYGTDHSPKHGSWLNQAEIAIGMYSRQCLGDGRIGKFKIPDKSVEQKSEQKENKN